MCMLNFNYPINIQQIYLSQVKTKYDLWKLHLAADIQAVYAMQLLQ